MAVTRKMLIICAQDEEQGGKYVSQTSRPATSPPGDLHREHLHFTLPIDGYRLTRVCRSSSVSAGIVARTPSLPSTASERSTMIATC